MTLLGNFELFCEWFCRQPEFTGEEKALLWAVCRRIGRVERFNQQLQGENAELRDLLEQLTQALEDTQAVSKLKNGEKITLGGV